MDTKRSKNRTRFQTATAMALVAVGLLLINVLFQRFFLRADLTEEKEYTLSESTKKILKGLEDPVTLKVYFSETLPPDLKPVEQRVFDLLDEYRIYSHSKINIVRVVPEESPEREQETQMLGIPPMQLNVTRRDKVELIKVYAGLALFYLDKKEVIPIAIRVDQLEYDLTSAVLKLTSQNAPRLGLIVPPPKEGELGAYTLLEQVLKRQFDLTKPDPSFDNPVESPFDLLLVVDPQDEGEGMKKELDLLFDKGIPVVILAGRVDVASDLETSTHLTGLEDWLKGKGIELDPKLIIDPKNHANATFNSGQMQYNMPYPFFVQVTREGLNQQNVVTAKLENIMFPWTNTLKFHSEEHADWKYEPLASSSDATLAQEGQPDVNPRALENFQPGGGEGEQTIAALVDAPPIDAKEINQPHSGGEGEAPTALPAEGATRAPVKDPERRLVVVANAQFIRDQVIRDYEGNLVFVQNLLDWLTLGDQLIGIRSRGKTSRPITPPSPTAVSAIKFGHMVGIPLAVIGFGILLAILRKRKRERVAVYFRI